MARSTTIPLLCRIDTLDELEYFRHGGILQYVLRQHDESREHSAANRGDAAETARIVSVHAGLPSRMLPAAHPL